MSSNHLTIFFWSDIAPRVFCVHNRTPHLRASFHRALVEIVAIAGSANSPEEVVAAAHALHDELRARRRPGAPIRRLRHLRLFIAREIVFLAEDFAAFVHENVDDQW